MRESSLSHGSSQSERCLSLRHHSRLYLKGQMPYILGKGRLHCLYSLVDYRF
jgi:hypothetical protein